MYLGELSLGSRVGLSGDFPWLPSALQELDDPEEQAKPKKRGFGNVVWMLKCVSLGTDFGEKSQRLDMIDEKIRMKLTSLIANSRALKICL